MDIIIQERKKYCAGYERCKRSCFFYDNDINVGTCLFNYDPCDWDMERIGGAIEEMLKDTKIIENINDGLMKEILKIMPHPEVREDESIKDEA